MCCGRLKRSGRPTAGDSPLADSMTTSMCCVERQQRKIDMHERHHRGAVGPGHESQTGIAVVDTYKDEEKMKSLKSWDIVIIEMGRDSKVPDVPPNASVWPWGGAMINNVRTWEAKILRLTFRPHMKPDETSVGYRTRTSTFLRKSWRKMCLPLLTGWINGHARLKTRECTVGEDSEHPARLMESTEWATHVFREHKKEADLWADKGAKGRVEECVDTARVVWSEVIVLVGFWMAIATTVIVVVA